MTHIIRQAKNFLITRQLVCQHTFCQNGVFTKKNSYAFFPPKNITCINIGLSTGKILATVHNTYSILSQTNASVAVVVLSGNDDVWRIMYPQINSVNTQWQLTQTIQFELNIQ